MRQTFKTSIARVRHGVFSVLTNLDLLMLSFTWS